jgi:hypothetical protein
MITNERIAITSRKIAMTAGVLYLLTFVSIPTLSLYTSIHNPNYILGTGADTNVFIGVVLELIVALTGIGTAVALYPLLKRQNQGAALGFIGIRVLEASTIFAGTAFLLTVVTLKQNGIGAEGLATSQALVSLYDRIFIVGQGFLPAFDDLLLGYLLYKSRLVPRALSVIGLVGVPLLIFGFLANMFGLIDRISPLSALSALPVAVFEFSLGIRLVLKGFNSSSPLIMSDKTNN